MEEKEQNGARTSALPSLDGFSLEDGDIIRVSRRDPDTGFWREYSVSVGELARAVIIRARRG